MGMYHLITVKISNITDIPQFNYCTYINTPNFSQAVVHPLNYPTQLLGQDILKTILFFFRNRFIGGTTISLGKTSTFKQSPFFSFFPEPGKIWRYLPTKRCMVDVYGDIFFTKFLWLKKWYSTNSLGTCNGHYRFPQSYSYFMCFDKVEHILTNMSLYIYIHMCSVYIYIYIQIVSLL